MTIGDPFAHVEKYCFVYCGPERCDCMANRTYEKIYTQEQIEKVTDYINLKLSSYDFDTVDHKLQTLEVMTLDVHEIIAWARGTYPVRAMLPSWRDYIERSFLHLSSIYDAEKAKLLLKGLLEYVPTQPDNPTES